MLAEPRGVSQPRAASAYRDPALLPLPSWHQQALQTARQHRQHPPAPGASPHMATSVLYCMSVCGAYAATSVIITFANKIVLSTYGFKHELSLVLAQLVLNTLAMAVLFIAGICDAPPLNAATFRKSIPLAFWFFVYVISGLSSLRSLTVPTWSALRRLTAIFILLFDYIYDSQKAPTGIISSVALMLAGGVVAAAGDFDGTWQGYVQVAVNCAASALYLRAINTLRRSAGVSEVGALFLTNLLCLGPVLMGMLVTREFSRVALFAHFGDTGFRLALFGSAALAGLLNYFVFLSAAVNSPLTTSITGQAKNVVGSLGGYLLLPASAGPSVPLHPDVSCCHCFLRAGAVTNWRRHMRARISIT